MWLFARKYTPVWSFCIALQKWPIGLRPFQTLLKKERTSFAVSEAIYRLAIKFMFRPPMPLPCFLRANCLTFLHQASFDLFLAVYQSDNFSFCFQPIPKIIARVKASFFRFVIGSLSNHGIKIGGLNWWRCLQSKTKLYQVYDILRWVSLDTDCRKCFMWIFSLGQ